MICPTRQRQLAASDDSRTQELQLVEYRSLRSDLEIRFEQCEMGEWKSRMMIPYCHPKWRTWARGNPESKRTLDCHFRDPELKEGELVIACSRIVIEYSATGYFKNDSSAFSRHTFGKLDGILQLYSKEFSAWVLDFRARGC